MGPHSLGCTEVVMDFGVSKEERLSEILQLNAVDGGQNLPQPAGGGSISMPKLVWV